MISEMKRINAARIHLYNLYICLRIAYTVRTK